MGSLQLTEEEKLINVKIVYWLENCSVIAMSKVKSLSAQQLYDLLNQNLANYHPATLP